MPSRKGVLRRVLEAAFEKVLRRVLRRCLSVSFSQKKPHVRTFSARNSSAGNGCANLMGAWHFFGSFCRKTPVAIKFLVLGGVWVFWRGGVVPICSDLDGGRVLKRVFRMGF